MRLFEGENVNCAFVTGTAKELGIRTEIDAWEMDKRK